MKSCTVNTLVKTNHLPQNSKKRYGFSLAMVVPQGWSHSHSGDGLFGWPKLSGKKNGQWHIHKHVFYVVHKICHNLIGWKCISCILFALWRLFDNLTILKRFFNVKLIKKWVVPRTVSSENYRVHRGVFTSAVINLGIICIADDRPILSSLYSIK